MPRGHFPHRDYSSFIIKKGVNILDLNYGFFKFNFPKSKLYHVKHPLGDWDAGP